MNLVLRAPGNREEASVGWSYNYTLAFKYEEVSVPMVEDLIIIWMGYTRAKFLTWNFVFTVVVEYTQAIISFGRGEAMVHHQFQLVKGYAL
ncbi:hypothetical protein IFM89_013298 [Coptis chinensis]|uniref:Uncharacterized protein n=1 Tax=Coptis chinensis TaxID=261450 RepID=A0A835HCI1_9MAGN|nr:hypothetical protein IFM89_013298 [Coptis chinensis]